MEGLFIETFRLPEKAGVEASELFPLQFNLVLYQSGPAFPLSLLILGIVLAYRKIVTWPAGILLSLSGITFPVGRILRKVELAHATDFLLLTAVVWIAFQVLNKGTQPISKVKTQV